MLASPSPSVFSSLTLASAAAGAGAGAGAGASFGFGKALSLSFSAFAFAPSCTARCGATSSAFLGRSSRASSRPRRGVSGTCRCVTRGASWMGLSLALTRRPRSPTWPSRGPSCTYPQPWSWPSSPWRCRQVVFLLDQDPSSGDLQLLKFVRLSLQLSSDTSTSATFF